MIHHCDTPTVCPVPSIYQPVGLLWLPLATGIRNDCGAMGRQRRIPPPSRVGGSCAIGRLADELHTSTDVLLDLAKRFHVWARTSDTVLRPAEADKLRDAYMAEVRRQKVMDDWQEKSRQDAVPGFLLGPIDNHDHEDAAVFRNLGLPVPKNRRPRRYPRPKPPELVALVGTAKDIRARWSGLSAESAVAFARQWADAMIESGDVIRWLDAGLEPAEAQFAARLAELHVKPDMLIAQIHGRTVLSRFRDDSAFPEDIARLLSNVGLL